MSPGHATGGLARWLAGARPAPNAPPGLSLELSSRAVIGGAWSPPTEHLFADAAGAEEFIRSLPLPDEPTVLRACPAGAPREAADEWLLDGDTAGSPRKTPNASKFLSGVALGGYASWLDFWEFCQAGHGMIFVAGLVRARRSAVLRAAAACVELALQSSRNPETSCVLAVLGSVRAVAESTAAQSWRDMAPGHAQDRARLQQMGTLTGLVCRAQEDARVAFDFADLSAEGPGRAQRRTLGNAAGLLGESVGTFDPEEFAATLFNSVRAAANAVAHGRAGEALDGWLLAEVLKQFATSCGARVPTIEVLRGAAGRDDGGAGRW